MDPIELNIFASRVNAVCEEMGAVLTRAALSPNIKDRLDFSCALFDPSGALCAQAAHIPVHLGSMAYAMKDITHAVDWSVGDMLILNDPYLGGTHLPDVTLVAPVFAGPRRLAGFVVNRAHHADIGASTPGSMPVSRDLCEEGALIPPQLLIREGVLDESALARITGATRQSWQTRGDYAAQISANRTGVRRLQTLIDGLGPEAYLRRLAELNDYAERLARQGLAGIPNGRYRFRDLLDDDGAGTLDVAIEATIEVKTDSVYVDFTGTSAQVAGNLNCPISVAAAAVYYCFRCLMPEQTPACSGSFRPIALSAPAGCLLNARRPAAVAAGNVETSSRVVDVILGALAQAIPDRIPAASHGTMNNIAMGSARGPRPWDYYETIGGGMGAGRAGGGLDAVQTHMTNTRNTPIESLEMHYPLRVRRYQVRRGSGGVGARRGGDGLVREYELLAPTTVTLLTERRRTRPWGLAGGADGASGENYLDGLPLPSKRCFEAPAGARITLLTPGGGGWGPPGPAVGDS